MNMIELGNVAEFINGAAFKPENWEEEGLKIIRIQNLTDPTKPFNRTTRKVDEKLYITQGDLLVSWSATLGVFVWNDVETALLNQHIFRVLPKPNIDKNFLRHALIGALNEMNKHLHGATMKHVNRGEFLATKIFNPPLAQQKRIAAILDKADEIKRKREQAIAKLDQLAQSIFVEMFGNIAINEKGWEILKFGDIGTLDRGVSKHRPRNAPELLGGVYPLVQTGEVANCDGYIRKYKNTYSEIGLKQSKIWSAGTLCITIAANIAKTGILTFDACFPDSVVGFCAENTATVLYVMVWLSFLQKTLEDSAPESAQKNINLAILRKLEIPFPPIALQEQFATRISKLEKLKASNIAAFEKHNELFASLQSQAFTGQL